jgi:hypothetical protein
MSVVTAYWNMFKQNIGIMVAVDQLAATQPRFAACRTSSAASAWTSSPRRCTAPGRRATPPSLPPNTPRWRSRCCSRQFTTVCLRPDTAGLGVRLSDAEAISTLSSIWKKTLYGY